MFDLTGSAAVLTGASRGIGFGIARAFLTQGANVVVGGHAAEETDAAVVDLGKEFGSGRVVGVTGDVADPATADALVSEALGAFGRLDHVVCNAGIDIIKPAVEYAPDEWRRVLTVNLQGAFQVAQTAARHWIANGIRDTSVTMTSSIAGRIGIPTLAPYAASKGGIDQLVRTLAIEWAPHGIRVNAVAPGYVDNVMDNVTGHDEERILTFTPLRRRATVAEIAAPFAFLASPEASYITGSVLAVDGGYTAG